MVGYLVTWLPNDPRTWLPGCWVTLVTWLPGYPVTRDLGDLWSENLDAWIPGYLATWLLGYLVTL